MKRYPAYKPSGFQQLGSIPEHWEILRLKYTAELNPSKSKRLAGVAADMPVTFLPMENVSTYGAIDCSVKRPVSEVREGFTFFEKDDVVVAKITPCFENGKGACLDNLDTPFGFGTTEFVVLRAGERISPRFLYKITTSRAFRVDGEEFMVGSAGQKRVSSDFIANFPVAVPPHDEQSAIVAYLDRKNAEIDRFVDSKRKLVALLNEERAAFIQKVVLRGLNPDAPTKPTGVDWLGEIPAHWEVKRVKYLFCEINERSETGEGVRRLSMSQKFGLVDQSTMSERPESEDDGGFKKVEVDDLVLNKLKSHLGVFATANLDGVVSPDYAVYRVASPNNVRYFERLFKTRPYIAEFTKAASGIVIGFLRLYTGDFFNIFSVCPPITEQAAIVAEIEAMSERVDAAISRIEREIELIHEYRTALVSEVVTGKIDVRDALSGS